MVNGHIMAMSSERTFEAAAAHPAEAILAPSETLWSLADEYCPSDAGIDTQVWIDKVCELNDIANPNLVQPGIYKVPDLRADAPARRSGGP